MTETLAASIDAICQACGNDRTRMMDIVRAVQAKHGQVSGEAMTLIAKAVDAHRVEVESVVSFYAFLSEKPKGATVIRLCNDIIDKHAGYAEVAAAFEDALGIRVGETTPDGKVTLEATPCIGMCDQAPAALVNDTMIRRLYPEKARKLVAALKADADPQKLVSTFGDGNNAHPLVQSVVHNNIRQDGPVIFSDWERGKGLEKCMAQSPQEVIRSVKVSRLRGRGGAGFPTGMKWDFTRQANGEKKVIICNADEGEPGTFKDRVLLTERAAMVFEGMTIAAYAIGAEIGVVYLRAEYAYLRAFLEMTLNELREANLLGKSIRGREGFDFDIRIQMGAGAYVCGEETALISSCEGLRGDPKNRPPFPAQKGYLGLPTSVNNVETFCCVSRIMDKGPAWFSQLGSKGTPGTKLLSISGDCRRPGVYEVEFGVTLREVLKMVGAEDAHAVQVGGACGQLVGEAKFDEQICYDKLATGGSVMVFNKDRDILEIVHEFLEFFVEESCGYCTPCRVGNTLLLERIERIRKGLGETGDLPYLEQLATAIKVSSRCGLGQTSGNPVLSTLQNFRGVYEAAVKEETKGFQTSFDLAAEVSQAEALTGRKSVHL